MPFLLEVVLELFLKRRQPGVLMLGEPFGHLLDPGDGPSCRPCRPGLLEGFLAKPGLEPAPLR